MLTTGKILRFDEVRGYGFIAPYQGDEDVFMHANDLVDEKYLYQAGLEVEFFLEPGDKGPKASEVRLVKQPAPAQHQPVLPPAARGTDAQDDGMCDVLPAAEFQAELTEVLLAADGTLTADQIRRVRKQLVDVARSHNWLES